MVRFTLLPAPRALAHPPVLAAPVPPAYPRPGGRGPGTAAPTSSSEHRSSRRHRRALLLAIGLTLPGAALAAPTRYPLNLENCGASVTIDHAPRRVVSVGQTQTEILYALGLGDRVVGTAVWFGPVAKPYEAVNAGVRRLADNDPSFEAVVGQEPDLVTAMFEWHVGPHGAVGRREQFAKLGIPAYVSPSDCVGKDNSGPGDGVRTEPFTMALVHRNLRELGRIFDVEDRAEAIVADLQAREAAAVAAVRDRKLPQVPVVLWFSSKEVAGDAFVAGRTGIPAYAMKVLGVRNVITTNEEWPLVGWEAIASANPAVIAVVRMQRRRFPADDVAVKLNFLKTDPVASRLDAVRAGRIVVLDVGATRAGLDTVEGIEALARGIGGEGTKGSGTAP